MAARKPNPISQNIEAVLAIAGLAVLILVAVLSIAIVPSAPLEQINDEKREYERWYKAQQRKVTAAPAAEDLPGELDQITSEPLPAKPITGWHFDPYPAELVKKSKEDAYFLGAARLNAEPGFNKVKVTVQLEELNKKITRYSAMSGISAPYEHLDPGKVEAEIYRGWKNPGSEEIEWQQTPSKAGLEGEGLFVLEDAGGIQGVTTLYYKAFVKAAEPFFNAYKLGADKPGPPLIAENVPPIPALTPTDQEVLKVVTLAPWSLDVPQTWSGGKIALKVIDHPAGETRELPQPLEAGDKIDETTFRLINIIYARRFIISMRGTISKIELKMEVGNRLTEGQFVAVPDVVWMEDPFRPAGDNAKIIEQFTRSALEALAQTQGGLDLGGATFDYENNFISNLLWRAVRTFPAEQEATMKDFFGREVKSYQYQRGGEGEPVALIPYNFTAGIGRNESLVLYLDPHFKDDKITYFAVYGKKVGSDVKYSMSGPYDVVVSGFSDTGGEDKVERLATRISDDVSGKLKNGTFAVDTSPSLVSLGDVIIYKRKQAISLLGDIGLDIKVVVQYRDENITQSPKLLEAPEIKKEKYAPPAADEILLSPEEMEFNKKLNQTFILNDKNPKYTDFDAFIADLEKTFEVKTVVDQSIMRIEGLDAIDFSLVLEQNEQSARRYVETAIKAFNDVLALKSRPERIKYVIRKTDMLFTLE